MTYRTVTGLAAALVVLGALALFSQYDPQPPASGGGLLLPGLGEDLDQVTRVTVTGAGNEPIATLQRDEDGGWTIAEKAGYPADVAKVRETLIGLAEARIVEAKTANPEFYDRLGVEAVENEAAGGVAEVPVTVTEFLTFDGLAITAESFERDDEPWVAFRAEYRPPAETPSDDAEPDADTEQELATEDGTDDASGDEAADESAAEDDTMDVAAEAQELDQRLAGWRYRIANYQFDQLTRRMEDLLRALPEDTGADE